MIDTNNLEIRQVITPDGEGTIIGLDCKAAPTKCTVSLKPTDGQKLGLTKSYFIDEVDEVYA